VLQDADEIASALRAQEEAGKLDWSRARIVIFQHIGNNYGAGLTPQTNWGVDLLMRLGGNKLAANAIYIAPYLEQREGIGDDPLPQETFTYYDRAWQSVADRLKASNKAFAQIKTIEVPPPAPILGDWGLTKADDLDAFVRRLKYTFENGNQLVSNATSFWIPGALEAVGWDPMKVTLPGFDTGFPDGVDGYPPMSVQQ
jgi:hypothetical protein